MKATAHEGHGLESRDKEHLPQKSRIHSIFS
jgi:hypothetical protein